MQPQRAPLLTQDVPRHAHVWAGARHQCVALPRLPPRLVVCPAEQRAGLREAEGCQWSMLSPCGYPAPPPYPTPPTPICPSPSSWALKPPDAAQCASPPPPPSPGWGPPPPRPSLSGRPSQCPPAQSSPGSCRRPTCGTHTGRGQPGQRQGSLGRRQACSGAAATGLAGWNEGGRACRPGSSATCSATCLPAMPCCAPSLVRPPTWQ